MSKRYGSTLKFIAFDICIHGMYLSVDKAHNVASKLNLDFVDYDVISTDIDVINEMRDKDSTQAIRNGMGPGHKREGVVLRPLIEVTKNNGDRIVAKHKREEERETKSPREIGEDKLKILSDAQAIADEWVTPKRLEHVLNKLKPPFDITMTGEVIRLMVEDIRIESQKETVWSKDVEKAISKSTALIFKGKVNRLTQEG